MEINFNSVKLKDIQPGELFRTDMEHNIFMKTAETNKGDTLLKVLCVNIGNSLTFWAKDNSDVHPVKATLTIE